MNTNLTPILKGNSWQWELKFWQDKTKTLGLDVSAHSFSAKFTNSAGVEVFVLSNADFAAIATNHRKVVRTAAQTNLMTPQELYYQLDVTLPDGVTVEQWQQGYVKVKP